MPDQMESKGEAGKPSQGRWTPHNPLGVIALFVFLIETIATVSLHAVADKPLATVLVWFIVLYPVAIAGCFFLLLAFKREALFGPMDFADQGMFFALLRKVERIEVKQEAVGIVEQNANLGDVLKTVDRLLELKDPVAAINVGRAFFNRQEYEKSLKVFEHIQAKTSPSSRHRYKVLANTAYAQIGLNRNAEAIENLLAVKKLGKAYFMPWHALALAYANLKEGKGGECDKWIEHVRNDGADEINVPFFVRLYPEMAERLKTLSG